MSPQSLQKQKVPSSYAAFAMNDTEQVTTLYEYEKYLHFMWGGWLLFFVSTRKWQSHQPVFENLF